MKKALSISEYIAGFPPEIQKRLRQIREIVKKTAPDAVEKISYGMPAFQLEGMLLYYAAHTEHIGFYPTPSAIVHFGAQLASYKTSKGAVQFPLDKPLPVKLIEKIVKFRVAENLSRAKVKTNT